MLRLVFIILIVASLSLFFLGCKLVEPDLVAVVHRLYHIDTDGTFSYQDPPISYAYRVHYEQLKDGRILISSDSLMIFDPQSGNLDTVLPQWAYTNVEAPIGDLSADGNYFYYNSGGSIKRFDLQAFTSQLIMFGANKYFGRPTLSPDGNYLSFLNLSPVTDQYFNYGGYPVWLDLTTGSSAELSSGDSTLDRSIRNAVVSGDEPHILYDTVDGLKCMDMDGSQRVFVHSAVRATQLSHDGRFVLCRTSNGSTYIYRDNQNMTWYTLDDVRSVRLCRASNTIFWIRGWEIWKLDMETGVQTRVLEHTIDGTKIRSISSLMPSWDGKSIYVLLAVPTTVAR